MGRRPKASLAACAALVACAAFAAALAAPPAGEAGQSGCSTSGKSGTLSLPIGGHTRTVIVHTPSGYKGTTAVPLVLNMHGSGSTAAQQEEFTGMDATADEKGFVVAYPQALIPEGTGFDWNIPGVPLVGGRAVPAGSANDVAFIEQLVKVLEGRYCIDARRVYATGFSGGARMSSQLACDASGTFAAVAPVSGLRAPTPCPASRAVPIISFHGTKDPVDPFGGHGQAYWTYSVMTAEADWAKRDGCTAKPAVSTPAKTVTLTAYTGCKGGSTIELYAIAGEGHEWPDGPTLPPRYTALLGPQSTAVSADSTIWSFFATHPLS